MAKGKMEKTMHEYKEGTLHSGWKHGPLVGNRKQAIAIGLSQARKAGELPPEHHSNPTEYFGSGDIDSIADGGGPLQCIEYSESCDQFEDGPDEFQMDIQGSWPGVKVKQFPRRQAY